MKIEADSDILPDQEAAPMASPTITTAQDDDHASSSPSPEVHPPSLRRILSLAKPEFPMLGVAIILMVASELAELLIPLVLREAYNALVDPSLSGAERMSDINRAMIIVLIIHGSSEAVSFFHGFIMDAVGERVVDRLRNRLYSSILDQEIAFFDEHKSGGLVSRLGSDTSLIEEAASSAVPETVLGVMKLCTCLALMFVISYKLASITVGIVILIFLFSIPIGILLGRLVQMYQDKLAEAQDCSTEAFGSIRTVQSFVAEDRERARYCQRIGNPDMHRYWIPPFTERTMYSVGIGIAVVGKLYNCWIYGVGYGAVLLSLWYGFKLVNDDEITLGDIIAFESFIFIIGAGLEDASESLAEVITARAASTRVFELLDRVPAIPNGTRKDNHGNGDIGTQPIIAPSTMNGFIEFRAVNFSYPSMKDVPVLSDFSLSIPPNTTAAIVGSSGSGKSTIISLLQRFYDVDSGSISVDGHDIRDLDLKWLRRHIGLVQQEPALFGLSVRENICYGVEREVSQEEIEHVSKEANAYDFIMEWPDQYDTLVGERGVKMSGGQKQRIAIARALLVNPRILLLDEATSALDSENEHLVQEAINKAVVGRTVLIVAHRLSTVQNAEQIVVIHDHRIADIGTHSELLDRSVTYRELVKRQSLTVQGLNEDRKDESTVDLT